MIIQENDTTIEKIGNVTGEAQFKMKTSRKAFQILSDLYSDKPLAIVRELGCNAADSMVAAGKKDQPFHIHLPNTLEPWITIQDFGTGISHENVYEIYSTYFESTKTKTNDQIGCLGLGSKSPFCYTDNFTVTSIHKGEKRIYNAFFSEQSLPTIALMSTEATTESDGVAIQIPVRASDFNNFQSAVVKAFRFFEVKPTISGGTVDYGLKSPIFSGSDWAFYEEIRGYYNSSYAIMGGVAYPIDSNQIDDSDYYMLLRNGLVMNFNIGELDFAPSREALSYCDLTKSAIKAKLDKVIKELPTNIETNIAQKETLMEAIRATYYLKEKFHFIFNASSNNDAKILWNGYDISEPYAFMKNIAPDALCISKGYRNRTSRHNLFEISPMPWYINNLPRGGENRVVAWVKSNLQEKKAMLFTEKDMKNLIAYGIDPSVFVPTSTLPAPYRVSSGNGTSPRIKVKENIVAYTLGETHLKAWERQDITPTCDVPKCYIVKGKNWDLELKLKGFKTVHDKGVLIRVCDAVGLAHTDVVMVSENEATKIQDRGSVPITEYFDQNFDSSINYAELLTISENRFVSERLLKFKEFNELSDDNKLKIAIKTIVDLSEKHKKLMKVYSYLSFPDNTEVLDFQMNENHKIIFDMLLEDYRGYEAKYLKLAKAFEKSQIQS